MSTLADSPNEAWPRRGLVGDWRLRAASSSARRDPLAYSPYKERPWLRPIVGAFFYLLAVSIFRSIRAQNEKTCYFFGARHYA